VRRRMARFSQCNRLGIPLGKPSTPCNGRHRLPPAGWEASCEVSFVERTLLSSANGGIDRSDLHQIMLIFGHRGQLGLATRRESRPRDLALQN
jgi:hypothetical protein